MYAWCRLWANNTLEKHSESCTSGLDMTFWMVLKRFRRGLSFRISVVDRSLLRKAPFFLPSLEPSPSWATLSQRLPWDFKFQPRKIPYVVFSCHLMFSHVRLWNIPQKTSFLGSTDQTNGHGYAQLQTPSWSATAWVRGWWPGRRCWRRWELAPRAGRNGGALGLSGGL